jgi:dTDP-4-dehydrorhamnose reductase
MTDLLITGANGQVGWELARRARSAGLSVAAFDRKRLNITDNLAVDEAIAHCRPKLVINAAAYTAVDKAESERDLAFAVNRDGAANLARACSMRSIPIVQISTDYVFDGSNSAPLSEADSVGALGTYGESKLAGEQAVRQLCDKHIIIRTAWVYGVHGHNFVKTMLRLAERQQVVRVVSDQFGSPTYAADLAGAILNIGLRIVSHSAPPDGFGTFHCAGAGRASWHDLATAVFRYSALHGVASPTVIPIPTSEYPTPARRPANSVLDCTSLGKVYGIVLRPWELALSDMLNHLLVDMKAQQPDSDLSQRSGTAR